MDSTPKMLTHPYSYPFWYDYQLKPNSARYNIHFKQRLSATLNSKRLKAALTRLLKEYAIFNAYYTLEIPNTLFINFASFLEIDLTETNCKDEEEAKKLANTLVLAPFDLTKPPLCRFGLFKYENQFLFVMVFHHIILDRNNFNELISSISNYYNDENYCHSKSIPQQLDDYQTLSNELIELKSLWSM